MDKKRAFLLAEEKINAESAEGVGYTVFYPQRSSSITGATIIGNTRSTLPGAVFPEKSELVHSGDPATNEEGAPSYRFNLRTHGRCWLDIEELKRLCQKNVPGLFVSEDSEYIYLKCSSEFDGCEILTPSDAVFAPSFYTVFAAILPPDTFTAFTCYMNLIIYLEGGAGRMFFTASNRVTGMRSMKLQTPAEAAPYTLCYTHQNNSMDLIALKKNAFAMFEFDSENPAMHADPYEGVNKTVYVSEPLRSLTDTDGTLCADEYSLKDGIIRRKIAEYIVNGTEVFYYTVNSTQLVFYFSIKSVPACANAPSEASFFKRADSVNALIGTEYHYAIGGSGKQIYFTLPKEYTTVDAVREFFNQNPLSIIYKLAETKIESADKYIPENGVGYTVFEAAALQRPRVKIEYAI